MSGAAPHKGSFSPPQNATPRRNDVSWPALGSPIAGNCATGAPSRKNIAQFLADCETSARVARRVIRGAAVADGGAR